MNHFMKIKDKFRYFVRKLRKMLNPIPLWIQLILIMILLTTAVSVRLIYKDYTSTKKLTLSQYLSTTSQILNLEAENSDWYLDSLAKFCLQSYYDSSYTRIIDQKTSINTDQLSYIKKQMYYNYYTRSDVCDYELYLVNQDLIIGRNEDQQHFTVQQDMDSQPFLNAAKKCKDSPRNLYIECDTSGNLTYYHTLFTVQGQVIQAVVQVTLDNSFITRLLNDHSTEGELFLLLNRNGDIVFSSSADVSFSSAELNPLLLKEETSVTLGGEAYYMVSDTCETGDLTLVCLMPEICIDREIGQLGHSILFNGFILWLIAVLLIYLLLRLLMTPLKAISTEDLVNDQIRIHQMITSLASNLRYTIKGNVMVPLRQEMTYTNNYVFLQKVRMGDDLIFSSDIDPASLDCMIPKISIQTLVENSIIHGKTENHPAIQIAVTVKLQDNDLLITVKDNGCGISEDRLQKIYEDFASQKTSGTDCCIGLTNLYSRMQILYSRETQFVINTEEGKYTSISLTLPISRNHSQDLFTASQMK